MSSGYLAEIEEDCAGCGECIDACQFKAIHMNEKGESVVVDFDKCMGSGVCESRCPTEAITLNVEPSKGGVFDLDELKNK